MLWGGRSDPVRLPDQDPVPVRHDQHGQRHQSKALGAQLPGDHQRKAGDHRRHRDHRRAGSLPARQQVGQRQLLQRRLGDREQQHEDLRQHRFAGPVERPVQLRLHPHLWRSLHVGLQQPADAFPQWPGALHRSRDHQLHPDRPGLQEPRRGEEQGRRHPQDDRGGLPLHPCAGRQHHRVLHDQRQAEQPFQVRLAGAEGPDRELPLRDAVP